MSAKSSKARGVAILFGKDLDYKIHTSTCDDEGNFILIDISIEGLPRLTLASLYAPNTDSPDFFTNIWEKISKLGNADVIICGDWNVVLDYHQDTYNYSRKNNPKARKEILRGMELLDLVDVWRAQHVDSFKFTWGTLNPVKRARLDYFLTSQAISNLVSDCSIESKYRSDHHPVRMSLTTSQQIIGPGLWKLNTSLLKNEELVKLINKEIILAKSIYAVTPYNPDFVEICPCRDIQLMIGDSLFWESLLTQIRGIIIRFSSLEKRKTCAKEKSLIDKIKSLEQNIERGQDNPLLHLELNKMQSELVELRAPRIERVKMRARAQGVEQGERSTKFFLQQEKSNHVNKTIKELEAEDKTRITKQADILAYVKNFYQSLYTRKSRKVPLSKTLEKLDFTGLKTIPEEMRQSLEGEITMIELTKALNETKNNKSPGTDGYPIEFYRCFWDKIGFFYLRAINENYLKGSFSTSQSQGLITCIPKGDKNRKLLKNWRPISLLNSSYKLVSSCIANRIKRLLPLIIGPQQKGFIKGRNIAECTREIYDFLYEYEADGVPGMMLLIDFEKAFDSIAWDFVRLVLEKFEFPQTIKNWVSMMHHDATSCVTQCGWISDPFTLQRGCRQGDPMSPYVFILCAEFLSRAIINAKEIEGFKIKGQEKKLTQFADDTSLFLNGSKKSLRTAISILKVYEEASGLKMNLSKTKAIWVGSNRTSEVKICHEIELDWVHQFTALGIQYDVRDLQNIALLNCNSKMAEVDRILLNWSRANTTLIGRILIIKSLALSKLVHFFIALPSPPKEFLREIDKKFYYFLWKGKPPKIKKKTLELDIKNGGLRMVNIINFEQSLKTKWLKKILHSDEVWTLIPKCYNIENVAKYGTNFYKLLLPVINNHFWKSVTVTLHSFHHISVRKNNVNLSINSPLWYNPCINVEYVKQWDIKGLRRLGDLLDDQLNIKTIEKLSEDFDIKFNFLDYLRLKRSIPPKHSIRNIEHDLSDPWCQEHILIILGDNKSNQLIKKTFLDQKSLPRVTEKWKSSLLIPEDDNFWNRIFGLPKLINQDIWMQMFQYKILHRILATEKKLFTYNIKNSPLCRYCKKEEESIEHLFCECDLSTAIWPEVTNWLKTQGRNINYLRDAQIILGDPDLEPVINRIILTVKIAIDKNKEKKLLLSAR